MLKIQLFTRFLLCVLWLYPASVSATAVGTAGAGAVTLTLGLLNTVSNTALTLFDTVGETLEAETWPAPEPGSALVWGSPLHLTWGGDDLIRYSAGFDASYSPPVATDDASAAKYLHGDMFRAWLRSGLEWNYIDDTVLAVGARWSPTEFAGVLGSGTVQVAATVTVPW